MIGTSKNKNLGSGTGAGTSSSGDSSSISTSAIKDIINKLRLGGNRNSTKKNYYTVWRKFNEFFVRLDEKPDSWEERLTLFVGHLIDTNKKSSTIRSYISAVKAVLKDDGVEINENKYLLTSLTRACRYVNDRVRIRLPIRKDLLQLLINKVRQKYLDVNQPYLATLYSTMFCTAYYGMFRIGEVSMGTHPILAKDVHIGENKQKMLFVLHTSKTHWKDVKPQTVKIESTKLKSRRGTCGDKRGDVMVNKLPYTCPFQLLRDFIEMRLPYGSEEEQFFIYRDRTPVKTTTIRSVLKMILKEAGFKEKLYNFHSFRLGRCVDLENLGISIPKLKILGRWRSNAVYLYLK